MLYSRAHMVIVAVKGLTCTVTLNTLISIVLQIVQKHSIQLSCLVTLTLVVVCLLLGWSVFWAGVAVLQCAVRRWLCHAGDSEAVVITVLCRGVRQGPAALLVQRLSRVVVCWSEHSRPSWRVASGVGQHWRERINCWYDLYWSVISVAADWLELHFVSYEFSAVSL